MSRILVVEHHRECPPALVGDWLTQAGCALDVRRPHAGEPLPALDDHHGLLILGGPMGAGDEAEHPWLPEVKELVRSAQGRSLPTLGICLGHQLIASALGGTVEPNPRGQQVGLLEVGWRPEASSDPLVGPLATPRRGVQWNDDLVVVLPPDATVLAATPQGEIQAVRYGPMMWGVQLHPEVDAAVVRPWAESDRGSHETRGIDTDAVLREIDDARAELDRAWLPLAARFAALVEEYAAR